MRLAIVHETNYSYSTAANYTIQYLRLSPQSTAQQKVLSWKVDVPGKARLFLDGHGNATHVLVVEGAHKEIRIRARGVVEVVDDPCAVPEQGPHLPEVYTRATPLTTPDSALIGFSEAFRTQMQKDRQAASEALMLAVRERVDYTPGESQASATATEIFAQGCGGSGDLAQVFITCCRQLDVPARYVSGYLAPKSRPATSENGSHESASHAWAEIWVEGIGWVGLDVASRLRTHGRHVRVAVGLDHLDACPIRGFSRGGTGETSAMEIHISEAPAREESTIPIPVRGAHSTERRLRH
jgi:transglutaminase-like putative cysteine protease